MRREADDSASKLRDFEERYKIVDLDSQSKAVVSAMASLRSQEISKELQLSYMTTFSSRDETTAVHVTMTAGTGVAYVSIVSATGDSQFLAAIAR